MQQRSAEWFAARRGRLTASIVGALLGLAPYMTKADAERAFIRELLGAESEFTGNIATDWGVKHEPEAALAYQFETDSTVVPHGFFKLDDWAGMSPDGLIGDDGLVEIKCPFGLRKDESPKFKSIFSEAQAHYYAQVQFQMYVSGRKWCDFYQWAPGGTSLERVKYDPQWAAEYIPVLANMQDKLTALAMDKKSAKPYLDPLTVTIEDEASSFLLDEYDAIVEKEKAAKERKAQILAELREKSGDRNAEIHGRKLTKVSKAGSISYSKVAKDFVPKGTNLEGYRGKPTEYWQLK